MCNDFHRRLHPSLPKRLAMRDLLSRIACTHSHHLDRATLRHISDTDILLCRVLRLVLYDNVYIYTHPSRGFRFSSRGFSHTGSGCFREDYIVCSNTHSSRGLGHGLRCNLRVCTCTHPTNANRKSRRFCRVSWYSPFSFRFPVSNSPTKDHPNFLIVKRRYHIESRAML